MIRSLHISASTNCKQNLNLFSFVLDVYFNHIPQPYDNPRISAMLTRSGAEIVVADADVVYPLLTLAGFNVIDFGKVSV